jgi:hypothetical protein
MHVKWTGTSAETGGAAQIRRSLRAWQWIAVVLVGLLGLAAAGSWRAPSAEARKKRDRTPTTIASENVSPIPRAPGNSKFPSDSKPANSVAGTPGKSGAVLVFPGTGKREKPASTVAPKSQPTLLANATAPRSGAKAKASTTSNRADPRLRAIGFRSRDKLEQHFQKHGREFGNVTLDEYLAMAQDLRDAPLSNRVIEANQVGGTVSRFDRQTGAFTAFDRDLTIRTFFKPNGGEEYFRRAATKTH